GADHAGGILDEAVVGDQPELAVLDVGNAVERVHQQAVGALVVGDGHGVGGEVAPAQVFENAGGTGDWPAGPGIGNQEGRADLDTDSAGKVEVEALEDLVGSDDFAAGFLQIFLEPKGVHLNCYVKVADGDAAGEIANGTAEEEDCKSMSAGDIANAGESLPLGLGEPRFQEVDVIGHRFRFELPDALCDR